MCAVVYGGHDMLEMMAVPVLLAADTHDVIVADHAAPHNVGARVEIVRIAHNGAPLVDHGENHALEQPVRSLNSGSVGEVALQRVRDDVGHAAGGLESGQALGKSRVHDGELRADAVGLGCGLVQSLFVGDDGVRGAFASGRGESENNADGQCGLRSFAGEEIPEVAVIRHAHRNGLCSVYDAAAADGDEKIDLLAAGKLDAFVDKAALGV